MGRKNKMKKLISILIVFLFASVVFSQNWHNNQRAGTTVPGLLKFHTPLVVKERVMDSDSTTNYALVGSDSTIRILLGEIPAKSFLVSAQCYVTTAFTGDGADSVCIGTSTDIDSLINEFAVSSTGSQTATLLYNYNTTATKYYLYYRKTVSKHWPQAGDVCLSIQYIKMPD